MDFKKGNQLANLSGMFSKIQKKAASQHQEKPGDLVSLNIEDVISNPQVRKTFRQIEELASSIKEFGLQQPITVTIKNENGKYVIIQGERRWRACKLAGLKTIDAIIRETPSDDIQRSFIQLTENIQRDDMDPIEIGKAIHLLHEQGVKLSEISLRLGKHKSYATRMNELAALPEELDNFRKEVSLTNIEGMLLLKKMFEQDAEFTRDAMTKMKESGEDVIKATVKSFYDALQNRNAPAVEEPKVTPEVDETKTEGTEAEATEVGEEKPTEETKVVEPTTEEKVQTNQDIVKVNGKIHLAVEVWLPKATTASYGYIATDSICTKPNHICVVIDGQLLAVESKTVTIVSATEE